MSSSVKTAESNLRKRTTNTAEPPAYSEIPEPDDIKVRPRNTLPSHASHLTAVILSLIGLFTRVYKIGIADFVVWYIIKIIRSGTKHILENSHLFI
jgi:hypothetical protein